MRPIPSGVGAAERARSIWCRLPQTTVYYEMIGDGRPIVFLHGWSLDHTYELSDFEPIFARRAGWQRIYPDLPGCGRTPGSDRIVDQDGTLEVILAFIDTVLGDRAFLLAGTSAGAYLARGVAQRCASRMDGLLLRVPTVIVDAKNRTLPPFAPLVTDPDLTAAFVDEVGVGEPLVERSAYLKALRARMESVVLPPMAAADKGFLDPIREDPARYGFSFDVDVGSAPFLAPTLIIVGRQDTSVGYRDAWQLVEQYSRATFVVLDRAGHIWPVDNRSLFEALVEDWLARVSEYR